jgi:hypothetical protein
MRSPTAKVEAVALVASGSSGGVTRCVVLTLVLRRAAPTGFHSRQSWCLLFSKAAHDGAEGNDEVDHHGPLLGGGNAGISFRHHGVGMSLSSFPQARPPRGNVGLCAGQGTFPRK